MFGSTVLEVAVGLTFCYATVALIVSSVQEALASALQLRARSLLRAIQSMLNDPGFTALARSVYAHALVDPQADGSGRLHDGMHARPAYIDPAHFAIALTEAIQTIPGDFEQLGRDIDALPDPQIKRALQGMYQRAGGDMGALCKAIEGWFNSAMVRVTGAYKRRAMLASLVLSLLLAIVFNIDSIHLFRSLWTHPALTAQIEAGKGVLDPATLAGLRSLPIGWQQFPPALDSRFALMVGGWILTASTALFGAPFWFDLMKRTVQVRGTEPKPDTD